MDHLRQLELVHRLHIHIYMNVIFIFGPKFGFLLTLTTYIEVWGHMITQNEALDEYKKLCYRKFFWPTEKIGPWGPKMAIFRQKHQVLAKNGDF